MLHHDLREIANNLLDQAQKMLLRRGDVEGASFLVMPNKQLTMVPMTFSTSRERQIFKAVVQKVVTSEGAVAGLTVGECWLPGTEGAGEFMQSPSDDPHRREAVFVTCASATANFMIAIKFSRTESGDVVFDEKTETCSSDHLENFFGDVFKPKVTLH